MIIAGTYTDHRPEVLLDDYDGYDEDDFESEISVCWLEESE